MKYLLLSIALIFGATAQTSAPKPTPAPKVVATAPPAPITSFSFKDGNDTFNCERVTPGMITLGLMPARAKWVCY